VLFDTTARLGLPTLAASSSSGGSAAASSSASSDEDKPLAEDLEAGVRKADAEAISRVESLREALHAVQDEFLKIEKFANVNTCACYKILKKHDKLIPATVCCRYYLERLHQQPWIRADHSAIFVVQMSDLFAKLRGKQAGPVSDAQGNGPKGGPGAQEFVRTTQKYWVSTEDVSSVKQKIAQHLPVFLMEREKRNSDIMRDGTSVLPATPADSQLTSSVYLDNVNLGLYHTRITKQPHAIAVRLRWYGVDPTANEVFVERKTHRESWTGEESVKERFSLPHELVVPFLMGQHTWQAEEARLRAKHAAKSKGKGGEMPASELEGTKRLFSEVQRAVESKQLQPTLRTVYMRTAFQVPYDASVRCSLDTSLAMLCENPTGQPTCQMLRRWYRDPELPLHRTEVTRFPHAVLEIKLALGAGEEAPPWVQELVTSGKLTEVHKFSKFMHGCAVLFPDVAHEVPYWVDDVSLQQSIQQAAAVETGAVIVHSRVNVGRAGCDGRGPPPGAAENDNDTSTLTHPLLAGAAQSGGGQWGGAAHESVLDLMGDARGVANKAVAAPRGGAYGGGGGGGGDDGFFEKLSRWIFGGDGGGGGPGGGSRQVPRTIPMKIEPKVGDCHELNAVDPVIESAW
jgi:SPX domain protein involved in polyphosphate accumulation